MSQTNELGMLSQQLPVYSQTLPTSFPEIRQPDAIIQPPKHTTVLSPAAAVYTKATLLYATVISTVAPFAHLC